MQTTCRRQIGTVTCLPNNHVNIKCYPRCVSKLGQYIVLILPAAGVLCAHVELTMLVRFDQSCSSASPLCDSRLTLSQPNLETCQQCCLVFACSCCMVATLALALQRSSGAVSLRAARLVLVALCLAATCDRTDSCLAAQSRCQLANVQVASFPVSASA